MTQTLTRSPDVIHAAARSHLDEQSLNEACLLGWRALTEVLDEAAPEVADVLNAAGDVARASVEAQMGGVVRELTATLEGADVPAPVREEVSHRLTAGLLPVGLGTAVASLDGATKALGKGSRTLLIDSPEVFVASAMQAVRLTLDGQASEIPRDAFGDAADLAALAAGFATGKPEWRALAALEQPSLADSASVRCLRPRKGGRGDGVKMFETTYAGRTVAALEQSGVKADMTVSESVRDLEDLYPKHFPVTILPGKPLCRGYVARIQLDDTLLEHVGNTMLANQGVIQNVAATAITAAGAVVAGISGMPAMVGLFDALGTLLIDRLFHVLDQQLEDRGVHSWVVLHTAATALQGTPISAVVVRSDGAPDAVLYTLTDRSATPSDDYGNRRMVEAWPHCRVLIGATEAPPRDCPSNWWDIVDRLDQPVVWSDGDGLASSVRVLLPYQRRRRIRATVCGSDSRARLRGRPLAFLLPRRRLRISVWLLSVRLAGRRRSTSTCHSQVRRGARPYQGRRCHPCRVAERGVQSGPAGCARPGG